jgi:hypothetical protein
MERRARAGRPGQRPAPAHAVSVPAAGAPAKGATGGHAAARPARPFCPPLCPPRRNPSPLPAARPRAAAEATKGIPDFWQVVFLRCDATRDIMNEKDVDVLRYLTNVTVRRGRRARAAG